MTNGDDLALSLNPTVLDPIGLGAAVVAMLGGMASDPRRTVLAAGDLALREANVAVATMYSLLGGERPPVAEPAPDDRRFNDRAWRENPMLRGVMEGYLVSARWWTEQLEQLDLPDPVRGKARFALRSLVDAASPSNNPLVNPKVWKEAYDTGGQSLVKGLRNALDDAAHNGGMPRQVDTTHLEVGKDLACTPGRVVFRNELMELLMYEAQTEQVHREPILCSPPWINKYYVMDLSPGRSFIEYAVQHGFTVFAISYRNPDESLGHWTMDDYLQEGLLRAIDVASSLTGGEKVNVAGLCLGGTLTGLALAYLAARGDAGRVGWATVTNTLLDFAEPGELGVFTDEATIQYMDRRMAASGYLDANSMARTFDWLRANDLVWNYVVSNWYMGRQPPAFDILAWNSDSTNLPAAMHSEYLRSCYLQNRLVEPGAFEISGVPIDLEKIRTPMYVLGAESDHIAPWRSTYRTTQLVGGEARFTLTSAGHIAGIVNPVQDDSRSFYWTREGCPADPEEWKADAVREQGSWWEHWLAWAAQRSGEMVPARPVPEGEPAPGRYVIGGTGPAVSPPSPPAATRPRRPGRGGSPGRAGKR